jgi:hypothetical protein
MAELLALCLQALMLVNWFTCQTPSHWISVCLSAHLSTTTTHSIFLSEGLWKQPSSQ